MKPLLPPLFRCTEAEFYSLLLDLKKDSLPERIEVYRTSIVGTLMKTLAKTFQSLEILLGEAVFKELCYRYASTHFSYHLNLNQYGEGFSDFIREAPCSNELPYLSDFTAFLFYWRAVFLDSSLAGMKLESDFPLYEIWQRCQPEFKGELEIKEWKGPFEITLYRENEKVRVLSHRLGSPAYF